MDLDAGGDAEEQERQGLGETTGSTGECHAEGSRRQLDGELVRGQLRENAAENSDKGALDDVMNVTAVHRGEPGLWACLAPAAREWYPQMQATK